MARIDLTHSFPPTTRSILDITEASRTSTQTTLNLVFNTNLGSSSSWVGTGITYVATVTVSGTGMSPQQASYTLKNSGDYWSGTGVHTTTAQPTFNIPASTTSINISVSYQYSDDVTTMSGSTSLSLSKMMSTLGNIGFINDTDTITLNITKYNNDYTHELNVYKRNNDDTIDTSVLYATRSGVENGDTFTFTQAELDYLYQQNTDRRNTAVMFVLSTYSGTTKIGDSNSKGAVNITNATPIFTNFDYEDSNIITSTLTGDNSKIVLGYSNLEVTIPVADKATPQKYATMESYIIDDVVVPYSSSADVTTTINNYNKTSISVFAKDSRDFSTEVNKPLTTIAYTPIVKGNQNIARVSNVGTQVNVEFEGTFWNDTFGNTTNDLTVTYRFKKTTDTNWTIGTFIGPITKSGNNFSYSGGLRGDASDNGFEVDDSYDIELTVSDTLSSVLYTYQLIAGNPAIIVKGNEVLSINNNGENIIDLIRTGGAVELYSNSSGASGNIVLNDSIENYKYIEISFMDNDGYLYPIQKFEVNYQNTATIKINSTFNVSGGVYPAGAHYTINGANMTLNYAYRAIVVGGQTPYAASQTSNVFFTKINGYK